MTTSSRLRLATVFLTIAATLLAVPAHAARPSSPDGTFTAPFDGWADARVVLNTCLSDSTCTGELSNNLADGRSSNTAEYGRTAPATGEERYQTQAYNGFTIRVPNGRTRVEVTFDWLVTAASTQAMSTVGTTRAYNGLFAYASGCYSSCSATAPGRGLQFTSSTEGAPGVSNTLLAPEPVSLTVTVAARPGENLPKWLTFYGRTYAEAGAEPGEVCLTTGTCRPGSPTHAGTAKASVDATLNSITVATS